MRHLTDEEWQELADEAHQAHVVELKQAREFAQRKEEARIRRILEQAKACGAQTYDEVREEQRLRQLDRALCGLRADLARTRKALTRSVDEIADKLKQLNRER